MTEADWHGLAAPGLMLRLLGEGVSERKLRLFACHCAELAWGAMLQRGVPVELEYAWTAADRFGRQSDIAVLVFDAETEPETERYANRTLEAAFRLSPKAVTASRYAVESLAVRLAMAAGLDTAKASQESRTTLASFLRDIFGNPFRPIALDPAWLTSTAVALARQMYESRDFSAMPILADALQDAGCDNADVLNHCRSEGSHVRGCWVVDLVLGKV